MRAAATRRRRLPRRRCGRTTASPGSRPFRRCLRRPQRSPCRPQRQPRRSPGLARCLRRLPRPPHPDGEEPRRSLGRCRARRGLRPARAWHPRGLPVRSAIVHSSRRPAPPRCRARHGNQTPGRRARPSRSVRGGRGPASHLKHLNNGSEDESNSRVEAENADGTPAPMIDQRFHLSVPYLFARGREEEICVCVRPT